MKASDQSVTIDDIFELQIERLVELIGGKAIQSNGSEDSLANQQPIINSKNLALRALLNQAYFIRDHYPAEGSKLKLARLYLFIDQQSNNAETVQEGSSTSPVEVSISQLKLVDLADFLPKINPDENGSDASLKEKEEISESDEDEDEKNNFNSLEKHLKNKISTLFNDIFPDCKNQNDEELSDFIATELQQDKIGVFLEFLKAGFLSNNDRPLNIQETLDKAIEKLAQKITSKTKKIKNSGEKKESVESDSQPKTRKEKQEEIFSLLLKRKCLLAEKNYPKEAKNSTKTEGAEYFDNTFSAIKDTIILANYEINQATNPQASGFGRDILHSPDGLLESVRTLISIEKNGAKSINSKTITKDNYNKFFSATKPSQRFYAYQLANSLNHYLQAQQKGQTLIDTSYLADLQYAIEAYKENHKKRNKIKESSNNIEDNNADEKENSPPEQKNSDQEKVKNKDKKNAWEEGDVWENKLDKHYALAKAKERNIVTIQQN